MQASKRACSEIQARLLRSEGIFSGLTVMEGPEAAVFVVGHSITVVRLVHFHSLFEQNVRECISGMPGVLPSGTRMILF